jgi:hypothetical protein
VTLIRATKKKVQPNSAVLSFLFSIGRPELNRLGLPIHYQQMALAHQPGRAPGQPMQGSIAELL